jgi:hypothetical protein
VYQYAQVFARADNEVLGGKFLALPGKSLDGSDVSETDL